MKSTKFLHALALLTFISLFSSCRNSGEQVVLSRKVEIDASRKYQKIDGFGVNFNPDQWRNGALKPVIDMLVDDLGATLFRFDPTGLAIWLDPEKRNSDGKYPEEYLDSVYTSREFRDAWEAFRYLNSKGIEPFLNVSGRIPPALWYPERPTYLKDFDGYAEMVVTMVKWAREKEGLKFSMLNPFNETNLSYPEGPGILTEDCVPATNAIVNKLNEYGLSDIKLMVMADAGVDVSRILAFLKDTSLLDNISHFGSHTYGDVNDWGNNPQREFVDSIRASSYKNCAVWMDEYGDLDQSALIEYEVGWRSTRRLLQFISDGYNAGLVWDAFDNTHKHDTTWSIYGLIKVDTLSWQYTPKPRFYAAKQVYRFVPAGYSRIAAEPVDETTKYDVYKWHHDPFRSIRISAFVSPDEKDFTIVGTSIIEGNTELTFSLKSFSTDFSGREVYIYRTSKTENCELIGRTTVKEGRVSAILKERSIITITTVK